MSGWSGLAACAGGATGAQESVPSTISRLRRPGRTPSGWASEALDPGCDRTATPVAGDSALANRRDNRR